MNEIEYTFGDLSFDEYNGLRTAVDWVPVTERQFALVKKNSPFITVARMNGKAIGITRAVGDGGYNFAVCDVIVAPDMQGKGIGRTMVQSLLDYIDGITEKGETVMIHLVAAKGKEPFYKKLGFIERPNEDRGAGMYIQKEKK